MKRPAFQFYPADWRNNIKLRRCSDAAKGAWIELLCAFHDSEEYGILRWKIAEISRVLGVKKSSISELILHGVLKGSDGKTDAFTYTPRHAGRDGQTVTLIVENQGPCWYSSRMVRDEYIRNLKAEKAGEKSAPKGGIGGEYGCSTTSSTTSSSSSTEAKTQRKAEPKPSIDTPMPFESEAFLEAWKAWIEARKEARKPLTPSTAKAQLNSLAKHPEQTAIAMIYQAIERGWSGIFPLQEQRHYNDQTANDRRKYNSL